ncbi:MAG TPA: hypothetical protein VMZ51_06330 [Acidimicrobiales bacterium]|nr:hypothetical protein [Acidimicrobiales bacterium]
MIRIMRTTVSIDDELLAAPRRRPGAVVGAVAVEHGATVISLDRDFSRFASVRHRRPGEDRPALPDLGVSPEDVVADVQAARTGR